MRRISHFDMMVFLDWCSNMEHVVVFNAWSMQYSVLFLTLYDCATRQSHVFTTTSALPPLCADIRTVAGVWSSPCHGLTRPEVISYVSLLERAEAVPLVSFVVPWKRELWRVVQDKAGSMSAVQFVSAIAYCSTNMERQTFVRTRDQLVLISLDKNPVRRQTFIYQRLLSCLQAHDTRTFLDLLQ